MRRRFREVREVKEVKEPVDGYKEIHPETGLTLEEAAAFWNRLFSQEIEEEAKETERITEQVNQFNEQVRETNQVIFNEQNDLFRRTTM